MKWSKNILRSSRKGSGPSGTIRILPFHLSKHSGSRSHVAFIDWQISITKAYHIPVCNYPSGGLAWRFDLWGDHGHTDVRRGDMITCYVHFISSFLRMLMLIFLSIAQTLQWHADGVARSSKTRKLLRQWWWLDDGTQCKQGNLCFIACLS